MSNESGDRHFPGFSENGKTLVVTPVGISGRGGIDRLNLYMSEFLAAHGSAAHLEYLGSRGERGGVMWVVHFLIALVRFSAMLMHGKYALVHIHVSTDGSAFRKYFFGWVARRFRVPYVIHFHGDMKQASQKRPPLWIKALGNLARGAQYCVVLGNAFVPPFRDVLGVASANIRIVHNGIPDFGAKAVVPRPAREAVHILFSGEVGTRKGVDLLIEALRQLPPEMSQWRCTIAGNGEFARWRQVVESTELQNKVRFTGWLDIGRIHDLMLDSDIVVLPSRAEALPLSLIEGSAAGAALVSCDVGAVRDVCSDGRNGIIVPHDPVAIAAALASLIQDKPLREAMQCQSRAMFLEKFHIARFVSSMLALHAEARGKFRVPFNSPVAAE